MGKAILFVLAVAALAGCQTTPYVSMPNLSPPVVAAAGAGGAGATRGGGNGWTPPPANAQPGKSPLANNGGGPSKLPASFAVHGRVVVDPGHGGKDPGTHSASGMVEKRLTLSLGLAAAERLRARGVNVRLTRADDRFIELDDRAAAASEFRADLFVSIHADWNPGAGKHGHTILLPQSHTPGTAAAANAISRSLVAAGWPCYSIRTDTRNLLVLRKTTCPALLVEIGFLSNSSDASQLSDPAFQARLGTAIADGIAEYLRSR